ncbi:MAG: YigZ family protein [Acidobacteriota bacterium]
MKTYRAPRAAVRAELREKGSRFLCVLAPADSRPAAVAALEAIRREFPDATHHCFAWRLGARTEERSSDDGEPAGTAGLPILRVLQGAELSDVLAVVVRWFGGTKLGKGGLVRAYGGAAREAIAHLATVERAPTVAGRVEVSYELLGAVHRLVRPPAVERLGEEFGERVRVELRVRLDELEVVEASLADLGLTFERNNPAGNA